MTPSLLPLPEGDATLEVLLENWPQHFTPGDGQRSRWLGTFEETLRRYYPMASRRDLNLTARHHAPFWLALGHDVP